MTIHHPSPSKLRTAGRFVWRYIELVIAMSLGVMLINLLWGLGLPKVTRLDVGVLVMAAAAGGAHPPAPCPVPA